MNVLTRGRGRPTGRPELPRATWISPSAQGSRSELQQADSRAMKRRLVMRDRLAWIVAIAAVGLVVYLVLPIWVIAAAGALGVGPSKFPRPPGPPRAPPPDTRNYLNPA